MSSETLSRRELQQALKAWGLPANGTTAALRERHMQAEETRSSSVPQHPANLQVKSAVDSPSRSPKNEAGELSQPKKKRRTARNTFNSPVPVASKHSPSFSTPPKLCSSVIAPSASIPTLSMNHSSPSSFTLARRPSLQQEAHLEPKSGSPKSEEKRLRQFRATCSASTQIRIDRAKTQRLFLVECGKVQDLKCEFVVLGSTGNIYSVKIEKEASCSCPDHANGHLCKHILFVLLKVMAIDPDSYLIYQEAWTESELRMMFDQMKSRFRQVSGAVLANERVRETFAKLEKGEDEASLDSKVARKSVTEDDCAICFDQMTQDQKTTYCRGRCGANFHAECIKQWLKVNDSKPTCPMCREAWVDDAKKGGYTNLATLQGLSLVRDTSTYPKWFHSPNHY